MAKISLWLYCIRMWRTEFCIHVHNTHTLDLPYSQVVFMYFHSECHTIGMCMTNVLYKTNSTHNTHGQRKILNWHNLISNFNADLIVSVKYAPSHSITFGGNQIWWLKQTIWRKKIRNDSRCRIQTNWQQIFIDSFTYRWSILKIN